MDAVRQDLIARIRASRGRKCVPESGPEVLGPACPIWLIPREHKFYEHKGRFPGELTVNYVERLRKAQDDDGLVLDRDDYYYLRKVMRKRHCWSQRNLTLRHEANYRKFAAQSVPVTSAGRGSF